MTFGQYLFVMLAVVLLALWLGHALWIFIRKMQCREARQSRELRISVSAAAADSLKQATTLRMNAEATLRDFYNMKGVSG
jgi:hypothetical protein